MRMSKSSLETLTKLDKIISLNFKKDSNLKMIKFGKGFSIEVKYKDFIFTTRLTLLILEL